MCCCLFHRFLIFSNMGGSLQSFLEEEKKLLAETTVLQLACRIVGVRPCNPKSLTTPKANIDLALFSDHQLDVLHYIHTNEYVHADVNAENIYIQEGGKAQVKIPLKDLCRLSQNPFVLWLTTLRLLGVRRYFWSGTATLSGSVQGGNTWSTARTARRHTRAPSSSSASTRTREQVRHPRIKHAHTSTETMKNGPRLPW